MKIDRNNYEEFFLLYTDNELSAEEKMQVELFVQQNPDLQEEFNMFQQSKLVADNNIIFDAKALLYRTAENPSPANNLEEKIILYTDNELNADEKAALELTAANNTEIQKQLDLFLLTKSVPDESIVFPYKESLYRKEETAKVIAFSWRRIAVAAILLLTFGTVTIYMLTKQGSTNNGTNNTGFASTQSKKATPPPSTVTKEDESSPDKKEEDNTAAATGSEQPNTDAQYAVNNSSGKAKPAKDKFINNSIQKYNEDNNNVKEAPQYALVNPSDLQESRNKINTPVLTIPADANTDPSTKPLSNDFNNTDVTPSNLVTYNPTEDDGNKRSRGLFRKVTRVLEHNSIINNATTDDNKLLIGSFAVSLK